MCLFSNFSKEHWNNGHSVLFCDSDRSSDRSSDRCSARHHFFGLSLPTQVEEPELGYPSSVPQVTGPNVQVLPWSTGRGGPTTQDGNRAGRRGRSDEDRSRSAYSAAMSCLKTKKQHTKTTPKPMIMLLDSTLMSEENQISLELKLTNKRSNILKKCSNIRPQTNPSERQAVLFPFLDLLSRWDFVPQKRSYFET